MFDGVFWFYLVWFGTPAFFIVFLAVTPSKRKWILEARHVILFGQKECQDKLLHTLKEKFKKKRGKRK